MGELNFWFTLTSDRELDQYVDNLKRDPVPGSAQQPIVLRDLDDAAARLQKVADALKALRGESGVLLPLLDLVAITRVAGPTVDEQSGCSAKPPHPLPCALCPPPAGEFPALQGRMRAVLRVEVEAVRFLKEEPHKLDSMLKKVRSLRETLGGLRR